MAEAYAQILLSLEGDPARERLLSGFFEAVARRGHCELLPAILRAYERKIGERRKLLHPRVTIARERDRERFAAQISEALASLAAHGEPEVQVDDALIGGYRVEAGHQRIDASYRRKLLDLYRAIAAHA
jgi:F0F1-type ATP synthase delta subunit